MILDFAIDDRTRLRSLMLEDAPELFALIDASRPYLRRWLNWVDPTKSEGDIRTFIQGALNQTANGRGPVCCITHANAVVGICGFKPIDKLSKSAELGYWLAETAAGQGLMTRCVQTLIDYAFRELQLNRIELRAATGNGRSRGVAKRLGFTQEGILRDAEWLNDHFVDQFVYSILRREWDSEQNDRECLLRVNGKSEKS
jgi:ribosomal-protein-serine acetyltransferase